MVVRALKFGIRAFKRIFFYRKIEQLQMNNQIEAEKQSVDNMLTANIPLKLDCRRRCTD